MNPWKPKKEIVKEVGQPHNKYRLVRYPRLIQDDTPMLKRIS
jgi:hypothetical protein